MTIEVTGPDGSIVEFPGGTPTSTMQTALAKVYGDPQTAGSALAQLSDPGPPQSSPTSDGAQSALPASPTLQGQSDPLARANLALPPLPPGGGYGPIADATKAAASPWLNALASDPSPVWNQRLGLLGHARALREAASSIAGSMLDNGDSPAMAGLALDPDNGAWTLPKRLDGVTPGPTPTAATWLGLYHTLPSLMETDPWTGQVLSDADSPRNANIASIAGQLSDAFIGDPLTGEGGAIPGYGPIQGVFGDPFTIRAAHDAMDGTLFSSDPSALTSAWAKASTPAEQAAARSAVSSEIQDRIQNGQVMPGQLGSPLMQNRLAPMFGPAGAQAVAAQADRAVNVRLAALRGDDAPLSAAALGGQGFLGQADLGPSLDSSLAPGADFAASAGNDGVRGLVPVNFIAPAPGGAALPAVLNHSAPIAAAGSSATRNKVDTAAPTSGIAGIVAGSGASDGKQPPSVATEPRMISDAGRDFIRRQELNPLTSQPNLAVFGDSEANPTFGWGHAVPPSQVAAFNASIRGLTLAQRSALAERIFAADVAAAQNRVIDSLGADTIFKLTQNQFDALVADAFNTGNRAPALGPNMRQDIWDGNMTAAGQQFNATHATNRRTGIRAALPGLMNRSAEEAAIFNSGNYYNPPQR
ncbi:MAG TPA: hypothetical protein VHZ26_18635 [Caulobacteraceae bacterium]|jgi:GH24 family phage-related lysozyme (muramidase)|nr:hypothetical protein [Caulobacteraceae bacterium]